MKIKKINEWYAGDPIEGDSYDTKIKKIKIKELFEKYQVDVSNYESNETPEYGIREEDYNDLINDIIKICPKYK